YCEWCDLIRPELGFQYHFERSAYGTRRTGVFGARVYKRSPMIIPQHLRWALNFVLALGLGNRDVGIADSHRSERKQARRLNMVEPLRYHLVSYNGVPAQR